MKDKNVLICDDEPFNLFALASVLEQTGVKAYTTLDVNEALEVCKNQQIDMVLMDLMMPELDGFMTLEILRKTYGLKQVPVVILTAAELSEADLERISKNNYLVLKKPIKPDEIYQLVNEYLV